MQVHLLKISQVVFKWMLMLHADHIVLDILTGHAYVSMTHCLLCAAAVLLFHALRSPQSAMQQTIPCVASISIAQPGQSPVFVLCSPVPKCGPQALPVLCFQGAMQPMSSGRTCMLGWSASLNNG